jgi:hypothetical protein
MATRKNSSKASHFRISSDRFNAIALDLTRVVGLLTAATNSLESLDANTSDAKILDGTIYVALEKVGNVLDMLCNDDTEVHHA